MPIASSELIKSWRGASAIGNPAKKSSTGLTRCSAARLERQEDYRIAAPNRPPTLPGVMAHDSPPDCRPNSDLALQDGQDEPSEIQQQKSASRSGGTRACDACRRRKIRCDAVGGPNGTESALAEQPCTLCTSQGVPCHFEVGTSVHRPPPGRAR